MTTKENAIVKLVLGVSKRYNDISELATDLVNNGLKFSSTVPKTLQKIEGLHHSVTTCQQELEGLQAERETLKVRYLDASFNGSEEEQKEILASREAIDEKINKLTHTRDASEKNLNRLRSHLESTREQAFTSLDEVELPDIDSFIEELRKRLQAEQERLEKRLDEAEDLYLLKEERDERERAAKKAQKAAEAARKAQERQERADRRKVLSRLLTRETVAEPRRGQRPRRGSAGWRAEADARGIEMPRDNIMPVTEAEFRLYAEVEAEYAELRKADGLPVAEADDQQRALKPKDLTRSGFISVMG